MFPVQFCSRWDNLIINHCQYFYKQKQKNIFTPSQKLKDRFFGLFSAFSHHRLKTPHFLSAKFYPFRTFASSKGENLKPGQFRTTIICGTLQEINPILKIL
jgi:hypothetical protein